MTFTPQQTAAAALQEHPMASPVHPKILAPGWVTLTDADSGQAVSLNLVEHPVLMVGPGGKTPDPGNPVVLVSTDRFAVYVTETHAEVMRLIALAGADA